MVALRRLAMTPVAAFAALLLSSAAAADPAADAVLAEVNAQRLLAGAPPVEPSTALERSSTRWARRLARRGVLRHGGMREDQARFRRLAEVLARQPGRRPLADPPMAFWMGSAAHRGLLLDPELRFIGVGHAAGKRATYWVARLGTP